MRLTLPAVALTIAFVPSPARTQQPAPPTPARLSWLRGCWERTTRTGRAVEHWVGDIRELTGVARLITDGRDRETEHLRIYMHGDSLVYDAHPESQAPNIFTLRTHAADSLVFEDPEHDFPQRIVYRRVGTDSLIATVGNIAGTGRPLRFAFRKIVECPAPSADRANEAGVAATLRTRYDTLVARELRSQGQFSQWFVDNGDSSFVLRAWASAGFAVPVIDRASYARNAEAFRNRTNTPQLRDRKYAVTMDRMLVRGDTAEVMVTTQASWFFVDTPGTYGEAGKERLRATTDRRVDTWMLSGGTWRLRLAESVSTELAIDGRVVLRNGARVRP
jgi:hypothetical protein